MFKNDRMMLILTGLVLAIFAGTMVQYGDRIMALMSGGKSVVTEDDSYSVRAGASQILDVLSNDKVKGPIVVLTRPTCGQVEMSSANRLSFSSDGTCSGQVEFAYCVDANGKCTPNAVKINVISVDYAQEAPARQTAQAAPPPGPPATQARPTHNSAPAQRTGAQTPVTAQVPPPPPPSAQASQAPEIAGFSVEMAPPTLAAPSVPELVSPSTALASIRRQTSTLNTASNTDQAIATQNSADIRQAPAPGPTAFSAPDVGEASNIALGHAENRVATAAPAPAGLQAASVGGSNIQPLERGPEALVSLQGTQSAPAIPEAAPRAASPEINAGAPVFVASAQNQSPAPDSQFSAAPIDSGPIALVALTPTTARGIGAGENLNIQLSEPGPQSLQTATLRPVALAPVSAHPASVSILAHGPAIADAPRHPANPATPRVARISISTRRDAAPAHATAGVRPVPGTPGMPYAAIGAGVAASAPVQARAPKEMVRRDVVSASISFGRGSALPVRGTEPAAPAMPGRLVLTKPHIDLTPARPPQVMNASLPSASAAPSPVITAPAQSSACAITLSTTVRREATIALDINAACKPNQMVTIEHAGIAFSVLTDAQGKASVELPAMQAEATVNVRFEDQSTSSTTLTVRDVNTVIRAGVSWQGDMNLDLTAIEFGAAIGSEGYITPATPRDYRSSRLKGGGYLTLLGDPGLAGGALAEVYTIPTTRNRQRGTIALSVVLKDVAPVCGQTIRAKTVRSRQNGNAGIRNVRFKVPGCDTILSGAIPLPGAIDDIRLAGR